MLRLDAKLRGRTRDEARSRQEAMRRAREEAEQHVRDEVQAPAAPPSPADTGRGE